MIHARREVAKITTTIRDNARAAAEANVARDRVSAVAGSGYYVGDQVIIINPSPRQKTTEK